jgi:uncharacterized membrane protein YdbT with pleckstrin-like domain
MILFFTTEACKRICVGLYLLSTKTSKSLVYILNVLRFSLAIILASLIFDSDFGADLFLRETTAQLIVFVIVIVQIYLFSTAFTLFLILNLLSSFAF